MKLWQAAIVAISIYSGKRETQLKFITDSNEFATRPRNVKAVVKLEHFLKQLNPVQFYDFIHCDCIEDLPKEVQVITGVEDASCTLTGICDCFGNVGHLG